MEEGGFGLWVRGSGGEGYCASGICRRLEAGGAAPVAVRYAWSRRHPWASLLNKDALPALAFRTGAW